MIPIKQIDDVANNSTLHEINHTVCRISNHFAWAKANTPIIKLAAHQLLL